MAAGGYVMFGGSVYGVAKLFLKVWDRGVRLEVGGRLVMIQPPL